MPPSTPKRKKQYLTRDQRLQILTLRDAGFTYDAITRQLHVTYEQVEYTCHVNHPTPKKRCGMPPILDEIRTQKLITFVCTSKAHRLFSYAQLALVLAWGVTEYVIQHILKRAGFKRYIALYKPPISEKNRRIRLAWAHEHLNWSIE